MESAVPKSTTAPSAVLEWFFTAIQGLREVAPLLAENLKESRVITDVFFRATRDGYTSIEAWDHTATAFAIDPSSRFDSVAAGVAYWQGVEATSVTVVGNDGTFLGGIVREISWNLQAANPDDPIAARAGFHIDLRQILSRDFRGRILFRLQDGREVDAASISRSNTVASETADEFIAGAAAYFEGRYSWKEAAYLFEWLGYRRSSVTHLTKAMKLYETIAETDGALRVVSKILESCSDVERGNFEALRGDLERRARNERPILDKIRALGSYEERRRACDVAYRDGDVVFLRLCYLNLCEYHAHEPGGIELLQHSHLADGVDRLRPYFARKVMDASPSSSWAVVSRLGEHFEKGRFREIEENVQRDPSAAVSSNEAVTLLSHTLLTLGSEKALDSMKSLAAQVSGRAGLEPSSECLNLFIENYQYRTEEGLLPLEQQLRKGRTAVLISGQLRGFERALPSIQQNVIERFDAIPFIATWPTVGFATGPHCFRLHRSLPPEFGALLPKDENTETFAVNFPHTAALIGEKRIAREAEVLQYVPRASLSFHDEAAVEQTISNILGSARSTAHKMAFLQKVVFEALEAYEKQHGFQFDSIVWLRPDLLVNRLTLPLGPLLPGFAACSSFRIPGTCGDYLAIGSRDSMMPIGRIWDRLLSAGKKPILSILGPDRFAMPRILFFHMLTEGHPLIGLDELGGGLTFGLMNPLPNEQAFRDTLRIDLDALTGDPRSLYQPIIESYLQSA